MNLNDAQKQRVAEWISQGLKLSDIQKRLADEFNLRLTYMDVRLLVDDLKLVPKDVERAKAPTPPTVPAPSAPPAKPISPLAGPAAPTPASPGSKPAVKVDTMTRPGAMVSGQVTFTDGQQAEWYIDQLGRLGIAAAKPGYKPPAADLQAFQLELEKELQKLGF
jgi:hypothetical protein